MATSREIAKEKYHARRRRKRDNNTMSDDNGNDESTDFDISERFEFMHHGGSTYFVYDEEKGNSYIADLNPSNNTMRVLSGDGREEDGADKDLVLGAVITHGPEQRSVEELQADNVANLMNNARDLQGQALEAMRTAATAYGGGGSGGGSNGGNGGGNGGEDDGDGEVSETVTVEHEHGNGSELVDAVEEWFETYSEVKGDLDTDALEVTFGQAQNEPGVIIDSEPFSSGYHDGSDWNDQDGFQDHTDAVKDITQGEDEIEYYGEPDYCNFLPAKHVEEVTG